MKLIEAPQDVPQRDEAAAPLIVLIGPRRRAAEVFDWQADVMRWLTTEENDLWLATDVPRFGRAIARAILDDWYRQALGVLRPRDIVVCWFDETAMVPDPEWPLNATHIELVRTVIETAQTRGFRIVIGADSSVVIRPVLQTIAAEADLTLRTSLDETIAELQRHLISPRTSTP